MSGRPDLKPPPRVVDPAVTRRVLLRHRACAACGRPAANGHHVVPKGAPHHGDDVEANVVPLCGTGTMGCHGAWHGSPYVVVVRRVVPRAEDGGEEPFMLPERRDADWVGRKVGAHILAVRPDTVAYVLGKLGDDAGRDYLRRRYLIEA